MGSNDVQVLIEYFDHKFDSLVEAFQLMTSIMARDSDLQMVKEDITVIKQVVTATNQDLRKLEHRVERLETALA